MKTTKAERIIWNILLFATGIAVGAVMYAMIPSNKNVECNDGRSIERVGDIEYHTYIPANDNCKE